MLHFVRVHTETTLYEFSRSLNNAYDCGNAYKTRFTLDHGLIHLTVGQYDDGSLRFVFSDVKEESFQIEAASRVEARDAIR